MKIAGIQELRADFEGILSAGEPVLVTRHGRPSGLFLPMGKRGRVPNGLHKDLVRALGEHLSRQLDRAGIREAEILKDFAAHRQRRHHR